MTPSNLLPSIDRASHLRRDTERLMSALDRPSSYLVPVWRNKNWVELGDNPRALLSTVAQSSRLVDVANELVWLGLLDNRDCFALDLSQLDAPEAELGDTGEFSDLRMVGGLLSPNEAELLSYARGMLRWHRHHRYCGMCGTATKPREGGHVRECPSDQEKTFPRTDPAIMLLVVRDDRCLLARQANWPPAMYSAIAGFVEPGETLEQAAAREAKEELGVDVSGVRYFRSQPWPFPASLMIAFCATTATERVQVDGVEIEEARWFTRAELENPQGFFYPPTFSLAHHLIRAFVVGDL